MNHILTILVLSLVFLSSEIAAADDGSGLKISAAVDIVGSVKTRKDSTGEDRFDVREAEILLLGPIDHRFDGLLSLAAHRENGVSVAEIHEAFISTSKLIPRSRIKVGQYFLGIGRLNRTHRHEWNFISAPKVHRTFFGQEGVFDTGIEYNYLLPLPFYLDLTVGVTNGHTFGHSHDAGKKPKQPTHYARMSSYHSFFGAGAQTGLNYLSRTSEDKTKMTLVGLDFIAKWKEASMHNFLLQSEAWLRTVKAPGAESEQTFGLYLFPQAALSSELFLGILWDYYTNLSLKTFNGTRIDNSEQHLVPTLTYKASEFSTLRLAYSFGLEKHDGKSDRVDGKVEMQATFILGAHPAHEF